MRLNEFNERNIDNEGVTALVGDDASVSAGSSAQMFRGTNYQTFAFVGEIRTDRNTRHSGEYDTFAFNTLMDLLGWGFRKSNTLSVTMDRKQATEYGNTVYRIYPFNDAQYLYSTNASDLIDMTHEIVDSFDYKLSDYGIVAHELNSSEYEKRFYRFLEEHAEEYRRQYGLSATDDPNAFADGKAIGEVLVLGHKYLAITTDQAVLKQADGL